MPLSPRPRARSGLPRIRRSVRNLTVLALATLCLLVAAVNFTSGGFAPHVAKANALDETPSVSPSVTDTPTNTATATPATPPSINLVSPSSGQGPVGSHVTISGSNLPTGSVSIYAASQSNCSDHAQGLTTASANGSGSLSTTFVWPVSLAGGSFFVCATGVTSAPSFQVLSASAPSISLSVPTIAAGESLTINGTGFVGLPDGAQILLSEIDTSGHSTTFLRVVVGSDGSFTTTWTVAATTGTMKIQAVSPQEGNAPPVLQATAQLVVTAAGSPTASASVSPTAGAGGSSGNNQSGNGSGFALVLVLIIVLVLLAGLGVAAFLLLRGRGGPPEPMYGNGPYGPGEYPGFAARNRETQKVPGIGSTGRQSAVGDFGGSDPYGYGGRSDPRIGGVANWDDPDPAPGPDWQPRPMSGRTRDFEAQGFDNSSGGGASSPGMTNPGGSATRGGFPPTDPWASQANGPAGWPPSQRPSRGSGAGVPPARRPASDNSDDWWGGNTNPADDGR